MAITYTKFIDSLGCFAEIDGQTNVVFSIQWKLNGTENVFNHTVASSTDVPYVAGDPFIPYADLTQQQVFNWIEQYTPPEQMDTIVQEIEVSIAKQEEIVFPPLPWQPAL